MASSRVPLFFGGLVLVGGLLVLKGGGGPGKRPRHSKSFSSLQPEFRAKVQRVFGRLSAQGFQPTIAVGWRNLAWQKQAHKDGRSKVLFSLHNVTTPQGKAAALAVDVIDARVGWGDRKGPVKPGNPESDLAARFFKAMGAAAAQEGLAWGGNYSRKAPWSRYGMGWDPAHLSLFNASRDPRYAMLKAGQWPSNLAV